MTTIVTVEEYRKLLDDYKSTDAEIAKRLQYLEAFCRNVIKNELQIALKGTHEKAGEKKR